MTAMRFGIFHDRIILQGGGEIGTQLPDTFIFKNYYGVNVYY